MPDNVITIESLSKRYRLGILVRNPYAGVGRLVRYAGTRWARIHGRYARATLSRGQPVDDRGANSSARRPRHPAGRPCHPDDNILWALEDINLALRRVKCSGLSAATVPAKARS